MGTGNKIAMAEQETVENTTEQTTEDQEEEEEQEYVCPPEFDEALEMRKMFVGGLDKDTTEDEFKELFQQYGEIVDHVIIQQEDKKRDGDQKKSERRFGFITFAKCDDLEDCLLKRP